MRGRSRVGWTSLVAAIGLLAVLGANIAMSAVDNGVTATFDPADPNGRNGFYASPVTISFSGADGDTCEAPITYGGPSGDPAQVRGTCTPADPSVPEYTGSFPFKYDDQAPTLSDHADIARPAGQAGSAEVNYAMPSGVDDLDVDPSVTCTPGPGATLSVGAHRVTCFAEDTAGNTSPAKQFTVTVDGAPTLNVPPDLTREATSPEGAVVTFTPEPSATDAEDDPEPIVTCTPASGTTFPLGPTAVKCTAADSVGNSTTASFTVTVRDTTAPSFTIHPQSVTVQAKSLQTGTPATNSCIQKFLNSPEAFDLVDGQRPVTHSPAPARFPLGQTTIDFTAADSRDNAITPPEAAVVTVAKGPQGECTVDARAPGNVRAVRIREDNKLVVLRWTNPGAGDFSHVVIYRSRASEAGLGRRVHRSRRELFRDLNVVNNREYRYTLFSVDEAGNRPTGVARLATPHRILLLRPRDGAVISRPPLLDWVRKARARYYNLQLYRMVAGEPRKVVSRWPTRSSFQLTGSWRFEGRRYWFVPGRYFWYVWPGYGLRSDANYGDLMGSSSFRVIRR